MFQENLLKILIFLVSAQFRFVYSEWWDEYNSPAYYYNAYSQMGYQCPYSQMDGYDYFSQMGYPYNAYLVTGTYPNYDHEDVYGTRADAIQPIIIVVENIDKRNDFSIEDVLSLTLGLTNLQSDYSSCPSTWCGCNSCDKYDSRDNYGFYSDCNRRSSGHCDSCKSCKKKGGCKKSSKNSDCGCHRHDTDSFFDCGCCKHIVICDCC